MASQEGISQDQTVDPGIDERLETRSIGATLSRIEQCSKLLELVKGAELEYLLDRSGLRTLFAPNNEALGASSPSDVEQFLNDHLVRGGFETFDLRRAKQLKTESGRTVPVELRDGLTVVGGASIVRSDVPCTNGVVQVIDRVLQGS
jgi:uncharacterized surface protein with fasciclin (FAS1) repeats